MAAEPIPIQDLSLAKLTKAIDFLLAAAPMRENAAKIKQRIAETNGVEEALKVIEQAEEKYFSSKLSAGSS